MERWRKGTATARIGDLAPAVVYRSNSWRTGAGLRRSATTLWQLLANSYPLLATSYQLVDTLRVKTILMAAVIAATVAALSAQSPIPT